MIECVFTLDYEIYGNGAGALRDLVYEPAERLRRLFAASNARFVAFVEVAELEQIEARGTDPAIDLVKRQIRNLDREGFEIGLHLHPQWSNARYDQGKWLLDFSEYNLCTLPRQRIAHIVRRSVDYLRCAVGRTSFAPLSFRAGSWLFQPTHPAAAILAESGIRIDSSVFKGGLLHNYNLDYRPALGNGYYWRFDSDVNEADPNGQWIEFPIHTELVPFWKLAGSRRRGLSNAFGIAGSSHERKAKRLLDFLRCRYPLKLDFCRMTLRELTSMMNTLIQEDSTEPELYRPIVAIGHTKDLRDPRTVDAFLGYLHQRAIPTTTFEAVYSRLSAKEQRPAASRAH